MKKESKFWKKGIKVLLAIGLLGSMLVPTSAMANEYVTPGNGRADEGTKDMRFVFHSLYDDNTNDDDNEKTETIIKENVKKGSTCKELGLEFPKVTYKDLKFLGWVDYQGNLIDENTVFDGEYSIHLYAKYEKLIIPVKFTYLDTNNDKKEVKTIYLLDLESTYRDLIEESNKYIPEDINKDAKFSGWEARYYKDDMDQKLNQYGNTVGLTSEFENKTVANLSYFYYDTTGRYTYSYNWKFIDKGTTYEEFQEDSIKSFPESFKGLRIKSWAGTILQTGVIENFGSILLEPVYENYMVRFMVDDSFRPVVEKSTRGAAAWADESEIETIYAFVAEKGDVITVPEINEYTNIIWNNPKPEGDQLVINGDITFYGYGDKVNVPDGDNDNNDTNVPDVTLPEEEINSAVKEVKNAAKGAKVTVDMKDNVTLPVEVLESARGKDVEVVFNMGAYSWSINGLDITAATLKAINLEVKLNANAISADVVKTLAGDRPTMQLSLSHNGEFGFKAKLQFNLGAEHKGKYGNLYYYNKDGKLEFMNAGKIDENGNVSLEFTHASDYVVVIDEKSMEPKNTVNPIQDTSSTVGTNGIAGMLLLAVLGGTCYLTNKKLKA